MRQILSITFIFETKLVHRFSTWMSVHYEFSHWFANLHRNLVILHLKLLFMTILNCWDYYIRDVYWVRKDVRVWVNENCLWGRESMQTQTKSRGEMNRSTQHLPSTPNLFDFLPAQLSIAFTYWTWFNGHFGGTFTAGWYGHACGHTVVNSLSTQWARLLNDQVVSNIFNISRAPTLDAFGR